MSQDMSLFAHLVPYQKFKFEYKGKIVVFDNKDVDHEEDIVEHISPIHPYFVDLVVDKVYQSGLLSEKELDEFAVIDDDDLAELITVL